MRRREFITLLGSAAAAWPVAAHAQQTARLPTIGFFSPNTRSVASAWTAAFVERLREVGWIEGRTMAIEYRWGEGRGDRTAEVVAEFIRLKPDVIVTHGQLNIVAAKQATSAMPIVFRVGNGPGRQRLRYQSGATRWQRYRPIDPRNRSCR
jgi:putative tryptophan/tyrosine transport system substrate-binding protein